MAQCRSLSARIGGALLVMPAALLVHQPAAAQDTRTPAQAVAVTPLRHIHARVTGVDPESNSVTLRDSRGEMAVIKVNPEVADVTKLQPGDVVNIAYKNAVLIRVEKAASEGIRARIETEVVQPGANGVVTSTRTVEVLATVLDVDRKNHEVTLRGPIQTEVFDVAPDVSLTNLKVGDLVRAVFIEAVAASVERVSAAPQ